MWSVDAILVNYIVECPSQKWTQTKKNPIELEPSVLMVDNNKLFVLSFYKQTTHSSDPRERNQRQQCWCDYLDYNQSVVSSCKYSFLLFIFALQFFANLVNYV